MDDTAVRFIYWRKDLDKKDGLTCANVHLLVGYNQGSIVDFQEMAAKLKKTFPQAKDAEIRCGKVRVSCRYLGFSIVTWFAAIPSGEYDGWTQVDDGKMEYCW